MHLFFWFFVVRKNRWIRKIIISFDGNRLYCFVRITEKKKRPKINGGCRALCLTRLDVQFTYGFCRISTDYTIFSPRYAFVRNVTYIYISIPHNRDVSNFHSISLSLRVFIFRLNKMFFFLVQSHSCTIILSRLSHFLHFWFLWWFHYAIYYLC